MITRTMDATFLNRVANDPDVRPFIGGPAGPLDLSAVLANPANYALMWEGGGWLLQAQLHGTYELHTLTLKIHRGREYFRAAREALRWLFTRTDALEIWTRCPDDNPGARQAAILMGFRERFHRDDAWEPGVGISYQALTLDDWLARDGAIGKAGHTFHETLEAAKASAGSSLPAHPDDAAHDRAVGAAVLMVRGGQVEKGVAIYNRWALFAGYATIAAVGPSTIDVRDAVLEIGYGAPQVLLVRGMAPPE